jgi:sugar phosphate isomerase/epimerase
MNISIASYAFHGLLGEGKMDVFGYLETCKFRYRVDMADIWNGFLPTTEEGYIRKVREAMDEKEMGLANLCVDNAHVWDPDPEERERLHQNALAHLRAAVILGALTVRIDMGGRDLEMTEEQFDFTAARYREYVAFAADHGFRVGPENHWGCARSRENMARLREAVDSPAFGFLLHFTNWADDPDAGDASVAPWAMHTHVAANVVATCLEEKMTMLQQAGYQGYWGVEHHSAKNEYAEVAWQLAEVRRVLARQALEGQPQSA